MRTKATVDGEVKRVMAHWIDLYLYYDYTHLYTPKKKWLNQQYIWLCLLLTLALKITCPRLTSNKYRYYRKRVHFTLCRVGLWYKYRCICWNWSSVSIDTCILSLKRENKRNLRLYLSGPCWGRTTGLSYHVCDIGYPLYR